MKIISYNVNGIRAAEAKGFSQWMKSENPDVINLQEIKAMPEQIDISLFENMGYHVVLNSAEKKGYSGVAVISKEKPLQVDFGMGISKFDSEGRIITAHFKNYTQISVYIPSGSMGDARQDFKMEFLHAFSSFIQTQLKTSPKLVISGDYNICHKPIDINHPERHKGVSGFLPEEREWFDSFLNLGLYDTFRMVNSEPNQYSWWSYRQQARAKNLGWRIDYHSVSNELKNLVRGASILQQVVHSDHCPIVVEF